MMIHRTVVGELCQIYKGTVKVKLGGGEVSVESPSSEVVLVEQRALYAPLDWQRQRGRILERKWNGKRGVKRNE